MKHLSRPSDTVSRETLSRLQKYADILLTWNRTINLISKADASNLWDRHIEDALQLVPFMPQDIPTAIDLGSGGGLPGIVLAIATKTHFHLVESDQRKAAFLREAARHTEAPITVHAARIETLSLPPAACVTARALAPLPDLLRLAHRFLTPNGCLIAPKGRNVEAELTAASEQWHMRVTRMPSLTDPAATILHITEVTRVGHLS